MMASTPTMPKEVYNELSHPNVTSERVMEIYKGYARDYDEELKRGHEYVGPQKVARMASEVLGNQRKVKILDIAAGTGLVGHELQLLGFTFVDGLDGSQEMLDKAKSKNIYQRYICAMIGPGKLDIEDNAYDAVTVCGAFSPGHLNGSCLPEIVRIIKPGGYFIGVFRESHAKVCDQLKNLEPTMKAMEDDRIWISRIRRNEYYHDDINGLFFAFEILSKK